MGKEKIDDFEASIDVLKDRMCNIKKEMILGAFLYAIAGIGILFIFAMGIRYTSLPVTFSAIYGGILFATGMNIFALVLITTGFKHEMRKFILLYKEGK